MTFLVGREGHSLVQGEVGKQRSQPDCQRIGGDIDVDIEVPDKQKASVQSVTIGEEIRELLEEEAGGKLISPAGRWAVEAEELETTLA